MTERPRDLAHPDALLALLVDGSASAEEREVAEAHLASCAQCRSDVAFARAARVRLRDLPELAAPDIAGMVARTLDLNPDTSHTSSGRRHIRGGQLLRVIGAAAAAALIGLGIYLVVGGSSGGGATSASAPERVRPAASGIRPPEATSSDFTATSIDSLAQSLAQQRRAMAAGASAGQDMAAASHTPPGSPRYAPSSSKASTDAETCTRRAGNIPAADPLIEVIAAATFGGRPAYVGAFEDPVRRRLEVIVADPATCDALYMAAVSF